MNAKKAPPKKIFSKNLPKSEKMCRGMAIKNRCRAVPYRDAAPNFSGAVPVPWKNLKEFPALAMIRLTEDFLKVFFRIFHNLSL